MFTVKVEDVSKSKQKNWNAYGEFVINLEFGTFRDALDYVKASEETGYWRCGILYNFDSYEITSYGILLIVASE